jgi:acetolactate synthase-1/2/3 large subunit
LAGDGINQGDARDSFRTFVQKAHIPVISSRFTHDILGNSHLYYGYVGSHGMRCANFILSKTDLILSLGNRLHFPPSSESFSDIVNHARIIRCDIDKHEFNREIPNTTNVNQDVALLLDALNAESVDFGNHREWIGVCDTLRGELSSVDHNDAIDKITSILKLLPSHYIITNDVGNNEFWVSRACVNSNIINRVLYSKSFGALGCGLGKAIGTYYATNQPVVCFVGDQGIQMNIQELQFISQQKLPVLIVLMNNSSSGMIKDREAALYGRYIHTTADSGYLSPSYKRISDAYGMEYVLQINKLSTLEIKKPTMMEIRVDEEISLSPCLLRGKKCQDMQPEISKMLYDYLDKL